MNRVMHQSPDAADEAAWYISAFGEHYPLIYRHRDDASARREIAALVHWLDVSRDARVLDIGCGAGRHLAALVEMGFEAIGIDLSEPLLAEAAQRPELADRLIRADMRDLPFTNEFDLGLSLFNSFGYFADDAENRAALRSMVRTLRPGGWLVMDHMNRKHIERTLTPEDERQVGRLRVINRRRIEDDHVIKDSTLIDPEGSRRELTERVRLFTPDEITAWFERAGMTVRHVAGDFTGAGFTEDALRMIVVGCRR